MAEDDLLALMLEFYHIRLNGLRPYDVRICRSQCAAVPVYPPSTKLPKNVPPNIDKKKPTFIVITASMRR
jgi:hypothetical protein